MNYAQQIEAIREYVAQLFRSDVTGHDFYHMKRVATVAKSIAIKEQGDVFICEAAGWLHDVGDRKLFTEPDAAILDMRQLLKHIGLNTGQMNQIESIIKGVSFTSGQKTPDTLEGKIVQDADRLDAIGAIGIARTFAYGAANDQLIHSNDMQDATSIKHFHDKLFKLSGLMHTTAARDLAQQRHEFMEQFMAQFMDEWV
ncbi:HD domain-containing protein [Lentibacillus saliphilus]|uniref:HD domain-containing protein n=1 Tax=Lentibacillus saliphilus TaxID=2737028 RepID=UPI001C2F1140|nr:HD domain-containing protein [Lentibacillus saliphilus]